MTSERRSEDQAGGIYGSPEAAAGWQRSGVARAQFLAPLTERMLDLAGVGIGYRVLDVAAGTGEQTLAAARRVGPTGAVLATDIATAMLELAAEAAARAGFRNVETRVMDARDLDLEPESFDAAISRLALMLVPERARAMAGIHRALKAGKKFVALVLAAADDCPFIALIDRAAQLKLNGQAAVRKGFLSFHTAWAIRRPRHGNSGAQTANFQYAHPTASDPWANL